MSTNNRPQPAAPKRVPGVPQGPRRPTNGARSWFTALAAGDGVAEILIFDEIGLWGISAADFDRDLKALGDVSQINLRINSPGGDVFDGIAIYNMLRQHKARVSVTIDGIAASMASVIAMAGDDVSMPENAFLLIHDPSGVVVGTSGDMRELADALDKVKESLVSAYAGKSGLSRDRVAEIMKAETWLTADEALDLGFADRVEGAVKMAANFRQLARFQNVPDSLTASAVSTARKGEVTSPVLRVDLAADMRRRRGIAEETNTPAPLRVDLAAAMRRTHARREG